MAGQAMGAQAMAGGAGGGGMPPQSGGQPPMTVAAQGSTVTTQVTEVLDQLKQILPQVVDQKGYVDMNKLITLWPQFSRIPFQVVLQLIQQSPELMNELIAQFGLNGIAVNGRMISADELANIGQTGRGAV
jgi:hypothetical protein